MTSDRPELPGKNDWPIAFRAIALAENLSGDAKRIAAIIIGFFNTKNGQCDPGTETLMRRAKVSKRTVVNATNDLDRLGLVVKVRHGGNGFRSRYQPKWARLRAIVEASEQDKNEPEIVQNGALRQCKSVHLDSAKACTLTHVRNSSKKLIGTDGGSGRVATSKRTSTDNSENADVIGGLLRGSVRRISVSKHAPPSVASVRSGAKDQLELAIGALGETMRQFVRANITAEIFNAGITAEQTTRGAGIRLVVDRVSLASGLSANAATAEPTTVELPAGEFRRQI